MKTLFFRFTGPILLWTCIGTFVAKAQVTTGNMVMVMANTPFSIDSLEIVPVVNTDISNRAIFNSYVPIPAAVSGSNGSIKRVGNIVPAILFRGTVGLKYVDAELNGNTPTTLNLAYSDGLTTSFNATNISTISNSGHYLIGTTGLLTITLKQLTAVDAGIPLPLGLISFNAQQKGNSVLVDWTTVNERNLDRFEVERSNDGSSFSILAKVKSEGRERNDYSALDPSPRAGWNFYRLKSLDLDGAFQYSPVVAIQFSGASGMVKVYPNPTSSKVYISIDGTEDGQQDKCTIRDVAGRALFLKQLSLEKGSNVFEIDLSSLSAGTYFLSLGSGLSFPVIKR